jgi:hypothetical protein
VASTFSFILLFSPHFFKKIISQIVANVFAAKKKKKKTIKKKVFPSVKIDFFSKNNKKSLCTKTLVNCNGD